MERNTVLAVLFSTLFLVLWWTFAQPKPVKQQAPAAPPVEQPAAIQPRLAVPILPGANAASEKEISIETKNYRAVFTTKGAAIKEWWLKEKNGKLVNLALNADARFLSTFPGVNFKLVSKNNLSVVFQGNTPAGYSIKKTFTLRDECLHRLDIQVSGSGRTAAHEDLNLILGPGLGTDAKELKENSSQTRALVFGGEKENTLTVLKPGDYTAKNYKWSAIDNRYFLAAVIPQDSGQFDRVTDQRADKKAPPTLILSKPVAPGTVSMSFYMGPKGYGYLKTYKLGLEETVQFGWFGFLGKIALNSLNLLFKLTGNYGWAIILLTILLQALVLPLSVKSFQASAAMKRLQPKMKEIQDKFKHDSKRLNIEVMNMYKAEKVNPLGGCLPMILQLPIFWALFTTLRNAYELRGAPWILWVHDLSSADTFISNRLNLAALNIHFTIGLLPILMGIGMLVQQQMVSVTTDPAQAKMMYIIPVVFTFMFMGFPSGLVLYWLVNSIMTMLEQYFFIHRPEKKRLAMAK
jgi:YidC/Oxa1 family membrane protein insertase